jgi:hypothetical protein
LDVFGWREVDHHGVAAEEQLVLQVLVAVDLTGIEQLLTWLLACA